MANTSSKVLDKIKELENQRTNWNVTEENLKIMLNYCRQNDLHKILEIGSYNGYSALNLALIAEEIYSIEIDKDRARQAKENCKVSNKIRILNFDAITLLTKFNKEQEQFDAIFIDGKKSQYKDYLNLSIPLLKETGMLFIDNSISHKDRLEKHGFFNALTESNLSYKELNTKKGLIIAFKTRKFFRSSNTSSLKATTES